MGLESHTIAQVIDSIRLFDTMNLGMVRQQAR